MPTDPGSEQRIPHKVGLIVYDDGRVDTIDHLDRLEPLPGGAYTFIEEIILPSEDNPGYMDFSDIPQNFRHLVLELALVGDGGFEFPHLDINANEDDGYISSVMSLINTSGTDTSNNAVTDGNALRLYDYTNDAGLPDGGGLDVITVKFPYYSKPSYDDFSRAAFCNFHRAAEGSFDNQRGTTIGSGVKSGIHPITEIRVWASDRDETIFSEASLFLGAGSLGSLYGIR